VAPPLESFYTFVKPRQEAEYGTFMVLLDRRQGERREVDSSPPADRRRGDRRTVQSGAAQAQLNVLGFAILHRTGEQYQA
jgi:hypothetical protein